MLKMIFFYFPNEKSTTWRICREYGSISWFPRQIQEYLIVAWIILKIMIHSYINMRHMRHGENLGELM